MQTNEIPLYSAEGACIGRRTADWAIWARDAHVALIVMTRKGFIVEAHMLQADGHNSVLSGASGAIPYSSKHLLASGYHLWQHKRLPKVKNINQARRIFRAVQADCMVSV